MYNVDQVVVDSSLRQVGLEDRTLPAQLLMESHHMEPSAKADR